MKQLAKTKVTVRLRKAEYRKEWFIYLESYPVYEKGKDKPQRVREYLNRSVTTVEWDKNRVARTNADGTKTYKPKRNDNGVIVCKSDNDRETMIYADSVRKLRQREYDNVDLYSDADLAMAEQKERLQYNFIQFFKEAVDKKINTNSSEAVITNWNRTLTLFKSCFGDYLPFADINVHVIETFRDFLLTAPQGGNKKGTISNNTARTYFAVFKACLKQAFIHDYLIVDISAKIKGIKKEETRREYLTMDELNKLVVTPCDRPELKRAALFSALTGLRYSDISKLTWGEIETDGDITRINYTQKKTKGVESVPISKQALDLCGERRGLEQLVFEDLPDSSWISRPLAKWMKSAGINKKITYHCLRHTFATQLFASGVDVFTVKEMIGHEKIEHTLIYAKMVDAKLIEASKAIVLENLNDEL